MYLCFKHKWLLYGSLLGFSLLNAQDKLNKFLKPSDTLNVSRRNIVIISEATVAGATLIGLNQLWYAEYDRSKFQFVNDNNEWLQMDKLGHIYSSYQLGRVGADLLDWSRVSEKNQLIYGSTLGFVFLSSVEVLDGYSKEWGFSLGDVLANASGTGLYVGQELLWNEQRIQLKYSFHKTGYAELSPDKLGKTTLEQILKDYNGQTYWLSVNMYSFFKGSKLPKWVNLAIGYGGEGMLSAINKTYPSQVPYRQYFLSFDVNFEAIKTNSRLLKSVFSLVNSVKIPFPALEINKKGLDINIFQ